MMKYARIAATAGVVKRYLPSSYDVVCFGRIDDKEVTVIGGVDSGGWTLRDYVLPRLASGCWFGYEIVAEEVLDLISDGFSVNRGDF